MKSAKYKEIFEVLQQELCDGKYGVHRPFPSEAQLVQSSFYPCEIITPFAVCYNSAQQTFWIRPRLPLTHLYGESRAGVQMHPRLQSYSRERHKCCKRGVRQ